MIDRARPGQGLRTFVDSGLIVALIVLAATIYVRFVDPYPPLWTAFAIPAVLALTGLRFILSPAELQHDGRSRRAIGGLLIVLSLALLAIGLFELDRANRSRAAHFDPSPTNADPVNSTVATDSSGDQ